MQSSTELTIRSGKHVPVEEGFWLAIFFELIAFSALFVAFLVGRFESDTSYQDFATSAQSLNQGIGLANVFILMTSSLLVARAVVLFRARETVRAHNQLLSGMFLGCAFIALKCFEYYEKLESGITATSNEFYNFYFIITGIHLLHVVIGLLLLNFVFWKYEKKQEDSISFTWVEIAGCYWHMVDFLWFIIFALLYLIASP